MAQFDVHRNLGGRSATVPFLVDVQANLLDGLATRVVVPLVDAKHFGRPARGLNPTFAVDGREVVMSTAELAGVSRRTLGPVVDSLAEQRATIIGALDLLITGL